jgi:Fur family transcriptional regulator, ferric uptake regulator
MDAKASVLAKNFGAAGYRMTKARKKILAVFSEAFRHMSVDDIYLAVKKKGEHVGITTIYRAVDSLVKAGILRQVSLIKGRVFYEVIDKRVSGHHHHLICRKCQKIIDYSDFVGKEIPHIKRLENIASKTREFLIDDYQISFTGLCKLCKGGG